jgi:hypothetical protein
MKSLFIRCSKETYDLAHALAKKESRSLNKQIIHMIHKEADDRGVVLKKNDEPKLGLQSLAETKIQENPSTHTNS